MNLLQHIHPQDWIPTNPTSIFPTDPAKAINQLTPPKQQQKKEQQKAKIHTHTNSTPHSLVQMPTHFTLTCHPISASDHHLCTYCTDHPSPSMSKDKTNKQTSHYKIQYSDGSFTPILHLQARNDLHTYDKEHCIACMYSTYVSPTVCRAAIVSYHHRQEINFLDM